MQSQQTMLVGMSSLPSTSSHHAGQTVTTTTTHHKQTSMAQAPNATPNRAVPRKDSSKEIHEARYKALMRNMMMVQQMRRSGIVRATTQTQTSQHQGEAGMGGRQTPDSRPFSLTRQQAHALNVQECGLQHISQGAPSAFGNAPLTPPEPTTSSSNAPVVVAQNAVHLHQPYRQNYDNTPPMDRRGPQPQPRAPPRKTLQQNKGPRPAAKIATGGGSSARLPQQAGISKSILSNGHIAAALDELVTASRPTPPTEMYIPQHNANDGYMPHMNPAGVYMHNNMQNPPPTVPFPGAVSFPQSFWDQHGGLG